MCQKKGAITRAPFSSAFTEVKRKPIFWFLAILGKNTGHRVTKFHPVSRINITYKFYFMIFSLTRKTNLTFFHVRNFGLTISRECGIE